MIDLESRILKFNPSHSEAILAFIENKEVDHPDAMQDFDVNIQEYDMCVVGEVHNFDSSYSYIDNTDYDDESCYTCYSYANELSSTYNHAERDEFVKMLDGLYEHIQEVHIK